MSKRDLQPIEVLTEILDGRRTVSSGARVLAVSVRQLQRLLSRILGMAAEPLSMLGRLIKKGYWVVAYRAVGDEATMKNHVALAGQAGPHCVRLEGVFRRHRGARLQLMKRG